MARKQQAEIKEEAAQPRRQRVTFWADTETWKELKIMSVKNGVDLQNLANEALGEYVKANSGRR